MLGCYKSWSHFLFNIFFLLIYLLLIYLHTKQWGNSKQLYEETASGQSVLQIETAFLLLQQSDLWAVISLVWSGGLDHPSVWLRLTRADLDSGSERWCTNNCRKKRGLNTFYTWTYVVYERELFSFIFRADTFLQPYGFRNHKIVNGFMELAKILLNMEYHRIDHHSNEIQFSGERGTFIWG